MRVFKMSNELWKYDGPSAWHFVTVPHDISAEIKKLFGDLSPGFGSIRIRAKIGLTDWKTSMFYDRKFDAYLLPVKSDVRKKEKLVTGDVVNIEIEVII